MSTDDVGEMRKEIETLGRQVRGVQDGLDAVMLELEELIEGVDAISIGMVARFLDVTRSLRAIAAHAGVELAENTSDDSFYEDAKRLVIEAGKASTSYLQRKLGVGYARAAHLIDMLEQQGVIDAEHGAKPRRVGAHAARD
jgi:S-DNA-T family DNA segregation ATPase FtsK/SpoIIIE